MFAFRGALSLALLALPLALLATVATASAAAGELTIDAPCLKDGQLGQRRIDLEPCGKVLRHSTGGKKDGALDVFEAQLRRRVNCFYKHVVVVPSRVPKDGSLPASMVKVDDECVGYPVARPLEAARPVCNLSDGEESKNRRQENCGDIHGPWENSQLQGLWVQAVKYYRNEVTKKIESSRALNVSEMCRPYAIKYQEQHGKDAKKLSDGITSGAQDVPPEAFTQGANYCSTEPSALMVTLPAAPGQLPKQVNLGELLPKNAACYLSISRGNRVAEFAYIAQCEVWSRVDRFMATVADQEIAKLGQVIKQCFDRANDKAGSESEGMRIFNDCYRPKIRDLIRQAHDRVRGRFEARREPSEPDDAEIPFLLVGSLLPLAAGARRRRETVYAGALGALAWFAFGCGGGGKSAPSPHAVCLAEATVMSDRIDQYKVKLKECCNVPDGPGNDNEDISQASQAGTLVQLRPEVIDDIDKCMACNPMNCPAANDTEASVDALAANIAGAHTEAAKALGSGAPTDNQMAPEGDSDLVKGAPTLAAAEEGGDIKRAGGTTPGAGSPKLDLPSARVPETLGKRGGGAGGLAGGGSTPGSIGGGGTGPASDSALTASVSGGAELKTDDGGGTYKAAGGGANAGDGAGSGAIYAGGARVDSGGAGEALEFGEVIQDNRPTMASDDPVDYFTRTELADSIFKIVEKKLDEKERLWTVEDLRKPSPAKRRN